MGKDLESNYTAWSGNGNSGAFLGLERETEALNVRVRGGWIHHHAGSKRLFTGLSSW